MIRKLSLIVVAVAFATSAVAGPFTGSGSYTVGSGGQYATLGAFFADVCGIQQGQGTAAYATATPTVCTGTGTAFLTEVAVGDKIFVGTTQLNVTAVNSDTDLTVTAVTGFASAQTTRQYFIMKAPTNALKALTGDTTATIISDLTEPRNIPVVYDSAGYKLTIVPGAAVQPRVTFTWPTDNTGWSGHIVVGALQATSDLCITTADNITIDGSNNGTNTRDLTFYSNTNYSYSHHIAVVAGSDNFVIKNCKVINDGTGGSTNVGTLKFRTRRVAATTVVAPFTNGNIQLDPQNYRVENCFLSAMKAGYSQVIENGISGTAIGTTSGQFGWTIANNDMEGKLRGIFLNHGVGNIVGNRISVYCPSGGYDCFGILLNNARNPGPGTISFSDNFIHMRQVASTADYGPQGMLVTSAGSGLDRVYTVDNNTIIIEPQVASASTALIEIRGIVASSGLSYFMRNNTILIKDDPLLSGMNGYNQCGFLLQTGVTTFATTLTQNVVIAQEPGVSCLRVWQTPSVAGSMFMDRNVYYGDVCTSGSTSPGTKYATLAAWQAAPISPSYFDGTFDVNSVVGDPTAAGMSNVDLHWGSAPAAPFLSPVASDVANDIDGQARGVTPAYGADEYAANTAPTGILIEGGGAFNENQANNALIARVQGIDPDKWDVGSITIANDPTGAFKVVPRGLYCEIQATGGGLIDFETSPSINLQLVFTDRGGQTTNQVLALTITDVNEAPTAINLSNAVVLESAAPGTLVGTLAAVDPDAGQTHDFTLVTGTGDTDNALFDIVPGTNQLITTASVKTPGPRSIRVRATDNGTPAQNLNVVFAITVDGPAVSGADAALGAWVTTAAQYLYDDGTHGDAVASDSIYTNQIALGAPSQWIVLRSMDQGLAGGTVGTNGGNVPAGVGGTVTFIYDKNVRAGWTPLNESVSASDLISTGSWTAVGSWQSEFPTLSADWLYDADETLMYDDGNKGDVAAGDGIFTLRAPVIEVAITNADWQIVSDGATGVGGEVIFSPNGWAVDPGTPGNGQISAALTQDIHFNFWPAIGRVKVTAEVGSGVNDWSLY